MQWISVHRKNVVTRAQFAPPDHGDSDFAIIEDELEAIHARLTASAQGGGSRAGPPSHPSYPLLQESSEDGRRRIV
jgi:hypothetical protein